MRTFFLAMFVAFSAALVVACSATNPAGLTALEARMQKLEAALQEAESARDAQIARVKDLEAKNQHLLAHQNALTKHANTLLRERDAAQAQLAARTQEKEQLAVQLDTFRRSLRELLGQVETAGR